MHILKSILWLIICILLQVLVFNHLHLFGAVVLVYVIPLIKMPFDLNHSLQVLLGFGTGLLIDIFCNTPGMHALAAGTLMTFRRPFLTELINNNGKYAIKEYETLGFECLRGGFATFSVSCVLFHAILLYSIEAFTLFNGIMLFSKIILGSILTLLFLLAVEVSSRKS